MDKFSPEMVRKKKAPSRRELSIARWAEMARKKKAPGRKEAHRFCVGVDRCRAYIGISWARGGRRMAYPLCDA